MLTLKDVDSVKSQIEKCVRSALAGDWTTWGNTLSDDIVFAPPNREPPTGPRSRRRMGAESAAHHSLHDAGD
jgi:hypothetical protein